MDNVVRFFADVYSSLADIPFGSLVAAALCVYGGLMAAFALACACSFRLRSADKRPVLHFVNAASALFFALMLTGAGAGESLFWSVLLWLAGYAYYGALCAFARGARVRAAKPSAALSLLPESPPRRPQVPAVSAPSGGARLDHALSIADGLLSKPLSRADRQELERMKTALTVIRVKGEPTPQENETVNDCFNALLKLMARYGR